MAEPKKHILIVEDDPDFATALAEAIQAKSEFATLLAGTVAEAASRLTNQKFAAILLDLRLKENSGEKIVNILRGPGARESQNFQTPIILMSGHLDVDVIKKLAPLVQGVLAKPFDVSAAIAKIIDAIAKSTEGVDAVAQTAILRVGPDSVDSKTLLHDMGNIVFGMELIVDRLKDKIVEKVSPEEQKKLEDLSKLITRAKALLKQKKA